MTFLMFLARYVLFTLQESPKYLLAKGRDQEALEVLQHVAKRNGRTISLTLEQFEEINRLGPKIGNPTERSNIKILKNAFTSFDMSHIKVELRSRIIRFGILRISIAFIAFVLHLQTRPQYLADHCLLGSNRTCLPALQRVSPYLFEPTI
ncbi:hypothetical protein FS749_005960, partial [Ceratobasidium sp. UAMH 11750]